MQLLPKFSSLSPGGCPYLQKAPDVLSHVASYRFSVQSLCHVQLISTQRTAAHQASPSITISLSFLKLMSIESVAISSSVAPFSSCPQFFPASESFPVSCLFTLDGQSIGASVSASALPINIQDLFSLRLTSLMSLLSKGLSRVFSSIIVQEQTEIECFWQPHGMVDHIRLFWIERGKGDIQRGKGTLM